MPQLKWSSELQDRPTFWAELARSRAESSHAGLRRPSRPGRSRRSRRGSYPQTPSGGVERRRLIA